MLLDFEPLLIVMFPAQNLRRSAPYLPDWVLNRLVVGIGFQLVPMHFQHSRPSQIRCLANSIDYKYGEYDKNYNTFAFIVSSLSVYNIWVRIGLYYTKIPCLGFIDLKNIMHAKELIRYIYFDLDDTLLNHKKAEQKGLRDTYNTGVSDSLTNYLRYMRGLTGFMDRICAGYY